MPPLGYFGTTKVPTALQLTKWLIHLLTKFIGSTIQLFSPLQLEVNASIALVLWSQYKELYLGSLVLFIFANLCIVCTPHIFSSKLKNANELPQSSISMILLKASTFSSQFHSLESIAHTRKYCDKHKYYKSIKPMLAIQVFCFLS